MSVTVLIRGGGDLGSGIALRLHRSGFIVLISELSKPLVVRRSVSFAQAIYDGETCVESVTAKYAQSSANIRETIEKGLIPVFIDDQIDIFDQIPINVIVDARMLKRVTSDTMIDKAFVIGIGPGFVVGKNCHAVVESNRGPNLGRVYWVGSAMDDTGIPEVVDGYRLERVLRSPISGVFKTNSAIGDICNTDQIIGRVDLAEVRAPFSGVIRGLITDGTDVCQNMKIGDIDPRMDPEIIKYVSDKARAIGGGVLEAILSKTELRRKLSMEQ